MNRREFLKMLGLGGVAFAAPKPIIAVAQALAGGARAPELLCYRGEIRTFWDWFSVHRIGLREYGMLTENQFLTLSKATMTVIERLSIPTIPAPGSKEPPRIHETMIAQGPATDFWSSYDLGAPVHDYQIPVFDHPVVDLRKEDSLEFWITPTNESGPLSPVGLVVYVEGSRFHRIFTERSVAYSYTRLERVLMPFQDAERLGLVSVNEKPELVL